MSKGNVLRIKSMRSSSNYTMMKWNFGRLLSAFPISVYWHSSDAICSWSWERERERETSSCVAWMHFRIHLVISNDKDLWYEAYFNDHSVYSRIRMYALQICIPSNWWHECFPDSRLAEKSGDLYIATFVLIK